jgi:hypothetical protein
MNGRQRAHVVQDALAEPGIGPAPDDGPQDGATLAENLGGIVSRAIRSRQLWLTAGYFAVLLLLARAYA